MFCHTALASISIPERVASSPAGELISRQNQTPTALVPGVELYKHGLWIHSSTNKDFTYHNSHLLKKRSVVLLFREIFLCVCGTRKHVIGRVR